MAVHISIWLQSGVYWLKEESPTVFVAVKEFAGHQFLTQGARQNSSIAGNTIETYLLKCHLAAAAKALGLLHL